MIESILELLLASRMAERVTSTKTESLGGIMRMRGMF